MILCTGHKQKCPTTVSHKAGTHSPGHIRISLSTSSTSSMSKSVLAYEVPQMWDSLHIGSLMAWQSEIVTEVIDLQQSPSESIESYWNRAATLQTKLWAANFVSADSLVVDCFMHGLRPALRNAAVPTCADEGATGLTSVLHELKVLSRILPETSADSGSWIAGS